MIKFERDNEITYFKDAEASAFITHHAMLVVVEPDTFCIRACLVPVTVPHLIST